MSETAAISTVPVTPPGPTPRAPDTRVLSDDVDLYAEANAFSEADWAGPKITDLFGKDGFDFKDLVDVINPLHHLPVVGTVYRALTGDALAPAPRMIGGTLFGGIAGFVTSLANTVLENETGRDTGDTVLAMFTDDTPAPANVAAATPPSPKAARKEAPALKPTAHGATSSPPPGGVDLRDVLRTNDAADSENPTAALIQAHAAVPNGGLQSAITLPGGKALPIQFRSGRSTLASPGPSPAQAPAQASASTPASQNQPQPLPNTATVASAGAAATGRPHSLQPTAPVPAAPVSVPPRETLAAATPAAGADQEIASKMLNALKKYETLMRSRTAPSISGEI